MPSNDDRNRHQLIRIDARNCFVESKNDWFHLGKAHLEFMAYDASRAEGSRATARVHIYIDLPEFLQLSNEALTGTLHTRMTRIKQRLADQTNPPDEAERKKLNAAVYESMGGTSAERMKERRADGMSQSRVFRIFVGQKRDYLLCAESGPGKTDAKGLIVPQYGNKPEQKVSVAMDWRDLNRLLLMTQIHYASWLTAMYSQNQNGSVGGSDDGSVCADDTQNPLW